MRSTRLLTVILSLLVVVQAEAATSRRRAMPKPTGVVQAGSLAPSKIEAGLQIALNDPEFRERVSRIYKTGSSKRGVMPFAVEQSSDGSLVLPLFIKTRNTSKTREALTALKGSVSTEISDNLIARVPFARIEELAARDEVERIEPSYYEKPTLDVSRREVNADQVHAGLGGLSTSYRGQNVIVGVVDSGVDWSHADFKNASGQTRFLSIWDHTTEGKVPSGQTHGYECTPADINSGSCPERDTNGHGTHVTGIAAGNGRTRSGAPFAGMAPDADIIMVKGGNNSFPQTGTVEGVSYIFAKATAAGKPAVVNLSLGGHSGPHDGSSLYEQSLSALLGTGHLIVTANGNEGNDRMHAGYNTKGTDYQSGISTFWDIDSDASTSSINAWWTGSISIGLKTNINGQGVAISPSISSGGIARTAVTAAGTTLGYVTAQIEVVGGAKHLTLLVDDNNGLIDLSKAEWEFFSFGSGRIDAWIPSGGAFTSENDPDNGYLAGDFDYTVGSPATAANMIAVGSYTTKVSWTTIDGITIGYTSPNPIGQISSFSSRGPTRDGRQRPIVSAPGEGIASALSSAISTSDPDTRQVIVSGGSYQIEQGTSQASPHVAGIVALMLQAKPSLVTAGVAGSAYDVMRTKARKDGFTGSSANNSYGDGKVDALVYVKEMGSGGVTPCVASTNQLCFVSNRYKATVSATDPRSGQSAPGEANVETIDTGYFTLSGLTHNTDNPEVVLKVVEIAPGQPWVFFGGLTDFEYSVNVTDTTNGQIRTYHKFPGTVQNGFDTGGGQVPTPETVPDTVCKLKPSNTTATNGVTFCSASSSNLCLFGSRFKVEVTAKDPRTGVTGPGQSRPKNDLFGFFSVPALTGNANNQELFIKVLDGRALGGKFWIFYGTLSDFEFTVKVTDTQTRQVRTYTRPGGSACGAADTSAFPF